MTLEAGLWEQLVTELLEEELTQLGPGLYAEEGALLDAEAADRLSRYVAALVARLIDSRPERERSSWGTELVRQLVDQLSQLPKSDVSPIERPVAQGRVLRAVAPRHPTGEAVVIPRPLTPLLDTTLLTNAPGEPAIAHELVAEIGSASGIAAVRGRCFGGTS